MNRKRLEWLLRDWGHVVSSRLEESGLPSATGIHRMMVLGIIGAGSPGSTAPIDDSWPYPELVQINTGIKSLDDKYSHPITYKRVLGYSYRRIAKEMGMSKSGVKDRMDKAEDELINIL